MLNRMTTISDRLFKLRATIRETAGTFHRAPQSIHLIAVSKRKPASDIHVAADAGQTLFGENHVQETKLKQALCSGLDIRWHMIGHLQKNKVKAAAQIFDCIHSIDSIPLAEKLNRELNRISRTIDCFIQVKLSGEESKTGVSIHDLPDLAIKVNTLSNLNLIGLMGIPPYTDDPEESAPYFRKLKELRDHLNQTILENAPIHELSMGMSHDFRVAIREGATYIRIGTLIFGERTYDRSK